MDLLATLDRFAHRTGLDVLTPYRDVRPRILRWLPIPALIGMPVGYAMFASAMRPARGDLMEAYVSALLFFFCYLAAVLMRFFGPRIAYEQGVKLDERERLIKARAASLSGSILTGAAIFACFYGAYASLLGGWMPSSAGEWVYLGFGLHGWSLLLPVLIASWLQPRPPAED